MKKVIILSLILTSSYAKEAQKESWLCLMQTMYKGFDGTLMKQEAAYDLAVTPKPEIWQYKVNWITNLSTGRVMESSYRKDPRFNKSVFLVNRNIEDEISKDTQRIKDFVFQKDKYGKLKYPCPYWIKAMYDRT